MIALVEAYRSGLFARRFWWRNIYAGINVAIVALPLSMAFAIASGARPEQGILTAMLAGFVGATCGGSRLQISGPTGAFIVILSGVMARYGMEGLQIATIMAGIMLVLLGVARMGAVIRYIPEPVIVGFTSGIAVIIWVGQWQEFFGLAPISGEYFHERLMALFRALPEFHLGTLALSCGALLLMVIVQSIPHLRRLPGPLLALILATLAHSLFAFEGVRTIGSAYGGLPPGLPEMSLPSASFAHIVELMSPAFTIAMLGAISALLSAVVADGMSGSRHDSNQEFIGQGLANIVTPLFGGFAATGGVARTTTNFRSGGTSPLAGIVHSIALALVLLFLTPFAFDVPLAALAAVLFVVCWNMSQGKRFMRLVRRAPQADVAILLLTFVLTVFADLIIAINLGVILATLNFLRRMAKSVEVRSESGQEIREEFGNDGEHEVPEGYVVYSIQGPFFFGAAESFQRALEDSGSDPKGVIIRLRWVPFIDATGIDSLESVVLNFQRRGVRTIFSGANQSVLASLERAGVIDELGRTNVFEHFEAALHSCQKIEAQESDASATKRSSNRATRILKSITGRRPPT